MLAPANTTLVCPLDLNLVTLIFFYNPYPKCCQVSEKFSAIENKCVPIPQDGIVNQPHDASSCLNADEKFSVADLTCDISIKRVVMGIVTIPYNLEVYCWDVENETLNTVMVVERCDKISLDNINKPTDWWMAIFFWVSLLLIAVTIFLYVAEPGLREKVYDKCFICHLANLIVFLIASAEIGMLAVGHILRGIVGVSGLVFSFHYVMVAIFSWLNVMCFQVWRTVKTRSFTHEKSFYAYLLYAQGLPVICYIPFGIDGYFSDPNNLHERMKNGGVFSNPVHLYFNNVVAVQQVISLCLLCHMRYMIWKQKELNGDEISEGNNCISQQKKMFSKLLGLFFILGLRWIEIIFTLYFKVSNGLTRFLFTFNTCPGYLIFIIYVWRERQVISAWKKKIGY